MKISTRTLDALQIIADHPGTSAREFGLLYWPDNLMHRKMKNGGHGAQRGKPGWLCAGSYLAKLTKNELVRWDKRGYHLTQRGAETLKNSKP